MFETLKPYFEKIRPFSGMASLIQSMDLRRLDAITFTIQPENAHYRPGEATDVKMPLGVALLSPQDFADFSTALNLRADSRGRFWFPPGLVALSLPEKNQLDLLNPRSSLRQTLLEELVHCATTVVTGTSMRIGLLTTTPDPGDELKELEKFDKMPKFSLPKLPIFWGKLRPDYIAKMQTKPIEYRPAIQDDQKLNTGLMTESLTRFIVGTLLVDQTKYREALYDATSILDVLRRGTMDSKLFSQLVMGLKQKDYVQANQVSFKRFLAGIPKT